MEVYEVGGAVRDALLGRPVEDHDWVVVGASIEQMLNAGYRPVGRDFPVFLHPETHEEYALARTERKSGSGYRGFIVHAAPDVTLEQDLARRDLTINAIARAADGTLIDPFHGQDDLRQGVLRHIGPAFVEDPVRVLRLARFAARFAFSIAAETLDLVRQMASAGELAHLVPERVWQETARGLMEARPQRFFQALEAGGALAAIFPDIAALPPTRRHALDTWLSAAGEGGASLEQRMALLAAALDDTRPWDALCAALRAPAACQRAGQDWLATRDLCPDSAEALLQTLERVDALRRPQRLDDLLTVRELVGTADKTTHGPVLRAALAAARSVDAGALAAAGGDVPGRIRSARLAAIEQLGSAPPR